MAKVQITTIYQLNLLPSIDSYFNYGKKEIFSFGTRIDTIN